MKNARRWVWHRIKCLNLFDSDSDQPSIQHRERLATRIYIICTVTLVVVLFSYIASNENINTYTTYNPTQTTIEYLFAEYSTTIRCPCNSFSMHYDKFISINYRLHEICSSQFITNAFISQFWSYNITQSHPYDFLSMTGNYFSSLATLCNIFSTFIQYFTSVFRSSLFSNGNLPSSTDLEAEAQKLITSFVNQISYVSTSVHDDFFNIQMLYQPLSTTMSSFILKITANRSIEIEPRNIDNCSCILESNSCFADAGFYAFVPDNDSFIRLTAVEGIRVGCIPSHTLLHSSFSCWYSDECYQKVSDSLFSYTVIFRMSI